MSDHEPYIVDTHNGKHYDRANSEKFKSEALEKRFSKECVKCGKQKLATADYFYRDKYRDGGLMPICKECKKKEYQEKKVNLKKKDIIIINPEGIEVGIMRDAKFKILKDGLKIVYKIQGFVQFSHLGNSAINEAILKELDKLEYMILDLK